MNVEAITREQTQSAPALTSTPIPTTHAGNFRDVLQRNDPLHTIRTRTSAGVPVHTVKAGETLSDICRKALQDAKKDASDAATWVAVQKVARENNLKNPDLINPGQILNVSSLQSIKIPVIGLEPASKSATASPAAATTASAATPVVRVAPLPPRYLINPSNCSMPAVFLTVMTCGAAYLLCQVGIPLLFIPLDHFFPFIPDRIAAIILYALIALGFAAGYLAAKVMDSILT